MNRRTSQNGFRQAFTLVELLVSIAIIAILTALLLGGLRNIQQTAKAAECTAKLRTLGTYAHSFIADNNNRLPFSVDYDHLETLSEDRSWMKHLGTYSGEDGRFIGNEPMSKLLLCPADPSTSPKQLRTYRYNEAAPSPDGDPKYSRSNYRPIRLTQIVSPSNHAMLFCVAYTGPTTSKIWTYGECLWGERIEKLYPPEDPGIFPRPHFDNQAVNILYYDGHVAKTPYPLPDPVYYFNLKPNDS